MWKLRSELLSLLQIASLLIFILYLHGPASAQTGSSLPTFSDSTLSVPRIDVEGYGSLELKLQLTDPDNLTFKLLSAETTSSTLTPGATYSLQSGILNIPLARADSEFYSLQLALQPGDLFTVMKAEQTILTGQQEYNAQCADCHGTDGQGGLVSVALINCANCGSHSALSNYIANVMPVGSPESCTDACADDTAQYILDLFQVDNAPTVVQTIDAITVLPMEATLRKASLQLVSRLPTASETALVASEGESGLRTVLDNMMTEDAFFDRLTEIFNDQILTDRYLSANGSRREALNLMLPFPERFWFGDPREAERTPEWRRNMILSNDGVAREPLQLINHVVKNDLPMTEILTADYFMVNPYSARSYGVFDELAFQNDFDEHEWLPAQLNNLEYRNTDIGDLPHAGILTSLMFLNRYPTSDTNRNRARSRVVYDLFMDVDILALEGNRPDGEAVDISSPAPTLDNDDCVMCHGLLDPVASAFENWNARGFYRPNFPWYEDMFQAGFAGIDRPPAEEPTSLQWLASQIALDPRFNDAMVRIVYTGMTGSEPLDPPGDFATDAEQDAYHAESAHLDDLREMFAADNQNLKTLIKEIVLGPYFRADGLENKAYAIVHQETGAARLLSPEMLHRKIHALLGFEWRGELDAYSRNVNRTDEARLLDNRQYYRQIYGGIDSFVVTERLTEPNGLMVAVQKRMANELACYAIPNDFLRTGSDRLLLPYVEIQTLPESGEAQDAIRRNLQHLHSHLLGEELSLTDPEIEASYQLFVSALQAGQSAIGDSEDADLPRLCRRNRDLLTGEGLVNPITTDPDYAIRAWIAVAAYLLSDYRFLYE